MTKVNEIWKKMNKSEKFGCQFALFPKWVQDYELTHEEIDELMRMPKPKEKLKAPEIRKQSTSWGGYDQ